MKYRTCSFFGHSKIEITIELKNKLKQTIEELINCGFANFLFGGFGMFDNLCHKIVTELKQTHTNIKRIYCLSDERHIRRTKRPATLNNDNYEEFVYLPLTFNWWYQRIYFRNCEMVNHSDFVIFYVNQSENSGAYKIMQYATKIKQTYINLGDIK